MYGHSLVVHSPWSDATLERQHNDNNNNNNRRRTNQTARKEQGPLCPAITGQICSGPDREAERAPVPERNALIM